MGTMSGRNLETGGHNRHFLLIVEISYEVAGLALRSIPEKKV
jgi:hypothetical protein